MKMTKEQEARLIEAMNKYEQEEFNRDESSPWTLDELEDGRVALAYCEYEDRGIFAPEQAWYNIENECIEYEINGRVVMTESMSFDDMIESLGFTYDCGLFNTLVGEMDCWINERMDELLEAMQTYVEREWGYSMDDLEISEDGRISLVASDFEGFKDGHSASEQAYYNIASEAIEYEVDDEIIKTEPIVLEDFIAYIKDADHGDLLSVMDRWINANFEEEID